MSLETPRESMKVMAISRDLEVPFSCHGYLLHSPRAGMLKPDQGHFEDKMFIYSHGALLCLLHIYLQSTT